MLLEAPDPVVADDPDDVDAEAHEGVEVAEREPERAVAPHHDDLPPGMRERGRERIPASRAETAVRARVDEPAGPVRVDVLPRVRHEVAAVADDDRVAVEAAAELAVDARSAGSATRRPPGRPPRGPGARPPRRVAASPTRPVRGSTTRRASRRRVLASIRARSPAAPAARSTLRATPAVESARCTTRASPNRPNPRRKSKGAPATTTRSASAKAAPRTREKASSWSAGSSPRPRPLAKTGSAGGLREGAQGVLSSRPEDVGPDHQDGSVGLVDQLGDRRDRVAVGRGAGQLVGPGRIGQRRRGSAPGVERDVDERRTTMGRARGAQRGVDELGNLFGRGRGARRLRDRRDDRHVVELLQRSGAPPRLRRASAEDEHRRPVERRRRDGAHAVRDARPRGQRGCAGPARHLRPTLRRERRRLLVARVDQPDAGLDAAVVEREEVPARQREQRVDVVAAQRLGRQPAAVGLELLRHAAGARSTPSRKPSSASNHGPGFSNWGE